MDEGSAGRVWSTRLFVGLMTAAGVFLCSDVVLINNGNSRVSVNNGCRWGEEGGGGTPYPDFPDVCSHSITHASGNASPVPSLNPDSASLRAVSATLYKGPNRNAVRKDISGNRPSYVPGGVPAAEGGPDVATDADTDADNQFNGVGVPSRGC